MTASDEEVAAVVAALIPRLANVHHDPGDPVREWRRQRQLALGMRRGA